MRYVPDNLKPQWMCKKAFKKIHACWNMFPITLRHKRYVKWLLKKIYGHWSLISIRPKKYVMRQLRKTHGYCSMFLIILKSKK